jgi:Phage integrase family
VSTVPARRPSGVLGADYTDSGLVITTEDGRAMHPETLSGLFVRQAKHAGLPPIRLHDLRHSVASILLAQGVHPKVVSEQLGHATHRAHVGHLQPHHSIAATGSRRRHCHCHPRFRLNAASTGRYGGTWSRAQRKKLASRTLTWPVVVGRDGIEPPTLRFSAARSTD